MGSKKRRRARATETAKAVPARRDLKVLAFAAILILAGTWAYSTSFDGVFVADDVDAIVTNPHVRSLWPLERAIGAPKDTTVAGRPVVSLSLALNYALASPSDPLEPWGYHAFNLLVHLCAGLALFGVVRRTLDAPPFRASFGHVTTPLAFTVALLWLLHPLQTESATYVVQRAESLMGLFLLVTLYCAIRAMERGTRAQWWVVASVVACALGMGSKEVMVVAPIIVALWLWMLWPDDHLIAPHRRWLFAGLAATWLVLAALVASTPRGESAGFGIGGWTWWSYLRTQAEVVVHYLRLSVVPSPLVFTYSWPPVDSWRDVAPQILFVTLLAAITAAALVRRYAAGLLGAWFFLVLAPTSSVLPIATEIAAEHRMYLPLAAVVAAIVLAAYAVGGRLMPRHGRAVAVAVVAVTAMILGTMTHARNRDYWSVDALMRDTVEKHPQNLKARVIYGGHLLGLERYGEAEHQLRAALALRERTAADAGLTAMAHMYLGSALSAQGDVREGTDHLEKGLALSPALAEAHALLGEAYASQGRLVEAAAAFERAVDALPNVRPIVDRAAIVFMRLAEAHAAAGRLDDAMKSDRRALHFALAAGNAETARAIKERLASYHTRPPRNPQSR